MFEDVWRVFAAPEGVYFQTQVGIFRWANGALKVWKPTGRIFNRAQFANDTLYIGQTGGALMALARTTVSCRSRARSASAKRPIRSSCRSTTRAC